METSKELLKICCSDNLNIFWTVFAKIKNFGVFYTVSLIIMDICLNLTE